MITANLFIDWDSASRVSRMRITKDMPAKVRHLCIQQAYSDLQQKIIDKLTEIDSKSSIRILNTRIYHGWHRGQEPTEDRRVWDTLRRELRPVYRERISYLPDVHFGNELICRGARSVLYDTLRPDRERPEITGQKMVDTALVSDLLSFCRSESSNFRRNEKPSTLAIVVGDDDDLLPGVFVAEAWGMPIYVFRITREHENRNINTNGIIHRL
ncbi:hypothetical protein [Pseudomonas fulva]|uniref:hypothetical protein n=1 Tax=Pseudomonas fulva TaxID=47880 RepID=UPI000F776885|nr:hypothetical protein [Pseudomonas fulva]